MKTSTINLNVVIISESHLTIEDAVIKITSALQTGKEQIVIYPIELQNHEVLSESLGKGRV